MDEKATKTESKAFKRILNSYKDAWQDKREGRLTD
jgi:hypothetical protein